MPDTLAIALAQLIATVGDVDGTVVRPPVAFGGRPKVMFGGASTLPSETAE